MCIYVTFAKYYLQIACNFIFSIILHLINSSNERPLIVPRDRPIFFRIGSKIYLYIFGHVHSLKIHIGRAVRRVQYEFSSCVLVQIYSRIVQ